MNPLALLAISPVIIPLIFFIPLVVGFLFDDEFTTRSLKELWVIGFLIMISTFIIFEACIFIISLFWWGVENLWR